VTEKMLLTIDIGNTNLTLGLYPDKQLGAHWRLATDHERMPDEYGLQLLGLLQNADCPASRLEGIALATVVPIVGSRIQQACRDYLNIDPLVVDQSTHTGLTILYDDPATVGADRIVDAVAARALFGCPACIVDFGTATTFDALNAKGDYLGGAITPGIGIAADALVQRTAMLPRVNLERPPSVIGRNTVHAMQSGLLFGYIALVEGMVARFRRELGNEMRVIGTGGLVDIIAAETKVIDHIAPWLTLDGLRMIWEMNQK
jgi:type III pantothenate kinase